METSNAKKKAYACYQCGVCTGICPMARLTEEFKPRLIVQDFQSNQTEDILKKNSLWLCAACYCCYENCPQMINVTDIIADLKGEAVKYGNVPLKVNEDKCIGCANCEYVCPYGAIKVDVHDSKSKSNPELCISCGSCAAECPAIAIAMQNFADQQMKSAIEKTISSFGKGELRIVSFLCNWSAYAGADSTTSSRSIRVMCTGRIDSLFIYHAFLSGADGVLIGACNRGDCYYASGNINAEKRINKIKKQLGDIGVEPERLRFKWISRSEKQKFADVITDFTEKLKKLGPSPLRKMR
ncbi:MAG: hydrogenase iron-sulfur subunit [Euryarchaeota archaeon]|nr:hydrogenase iron-sulfur subunit [Euryarchaeota archaeon]